MNPQTPVNEKKKGGRPKMADGLRRTYSVRVYFDRENYGKLVSRSKLTGMSLSSIVYELTVNGCLKEALPRDLASCLRGMATMPNNLNQLAHEAHLYGYKAVEERDKDLAEKIAEVLVKLSRLVSA